MSQDATKIMPGWLMPAGLADILEEDGEWEDASWDPLLLSVVADTSHEGRFIKRAWQLTLWPGDAYFENLNRVLVARGETADGLIWAELILDTIEAKAPALLPRLHDDSSREACVIWTEMETDGRALMERAWTFVHEMAAA